MEPKKLAFLTIRTPLVLSDAVIQQLSVLNGVSQVDSRLVLKAHVSEIDNFTIDAETLTTFSVGGSREGDSIVIGVNPFNFTGFWSLKGNFLNPNSSLEAVIGDSIAKTMYIYDASKQIMFSDPLVQSIKFQNTTSNCLRLCGSIKQRLSHLCTNK